MSFFALHRRSALILGVSALAFGAAATPVFAADATASTTAAAADNSETTIGELVVTAQKREQSLQEVPVAISAYTGAKRDLVGINSVQDMTNFTPGLQYSSQSDRISLRGVGRLSNVHTADSSVISYSDGVASTSTTQAGETPIFIDRLEVLRGPQGTLYGRNSIGGAINIVSRRPTKDPYAEVRFTYGNYTRTLLEGAVSGPLSDKVQYRLAANWERQDKGWFKNLATGGKDEGNVINQIFVEGQLAIQFSDKLETWGKISIIQWHNPGGGPGARASWTPSPYHTGETTQVNNLIENAGFGYNTTPGAVSNVVAGCGPVNPQLSNRRTFCADTPQSVKLNDTVIIANQWTYHADNFDVRYITGGTHYHYTLTGDLDGTAVSQLTDNVATPGIPQTFHTAYSSNYQEIEKWWSHEINILSTDRGPFQWLAGLYYYNESFQQPVYTQLAQESRLDGTIYDAVALLGLHQLVADPSDPGRRIYDDRPDFHIRSQAVFGQIDWKFTDTLKLTVGARYGSDHKNGSESIRIVTLAPTIGGIPGVGVLPVDVTRTLGTGPLPTGVTGMSYDAGTGFMTRSYDHTWKALSGTAGVDWTPDADTLVFAKYSRGYKSGGFRVGIDTSLGANPLTDKETVNAYEIGLKKTFGRTFQANIDAFYYDYRNAQVPLSQPATGGGASVASSILYNVPKSVSKGVEIETTWQPINDLQILVNYSYLDAHITQGQAIDPADPAALAAGATPTQTLASCAPSNCPSDVYSLLSGGGFSRLQNLKGNHLPNSSPHRVTFNANYTWRFDQGKLNGSVSYVWRAAQYGSIFDRSYYRAPSWSQVDGRLTWTSQNDKYTVILYVKNLFDTLGYANGATATRRASITNTLVAPSTYMLLPSVSGINTAYELTPPRTYGIEVHYKFF
ncbi:MAG TPA: TonB-dependent receptor [Caulobacteraceae bacterium]|nr:TonB-dependent receptor [Caulobacteraceae bacterium]